MRTRTILFIGFIALAPACSNSTGNPAAGNDAGETSHDGAAGNDGASPGTDGAGSGDTSTSTEAGATGAAAFVGSWTRAGTTTTLCPGASMPTTGMLGGTLVIALGTASDTVVASQPDGCMTTYTVAGSVASAMIPDVCVVTPPGVTNSNTSHTFTLSSDGMTIAEASVGTQSTTQPDGGTQVCTYDTMGTFTKQ